MVSAVVVSRWPVTVALGLIPDQSQWGFVVDKVATYLSEDFCFVTSVPFHQSIVRFFILLLLLPDRQMGEACGHSNKSDTLSKISVVSQKGSTSIVF